jgi:hypothetical protein
MEKQDGTILWQGFVNKNENKLNIIRDLGIPL